MTGKPQLVVSPWIRCGPYIYECSLCGRKFMLPEDRSPKKAAAELWAAFNEHVHQAHAEGENEAKALPAPPKP